MTDEPAAGQPEPAAGEPEPAARRGELPAAKNPGAERTVCDPTGAELIGAELLAAAGPAKAGGARLQFDVKATLLLPGDKKYGLELGFAFGNGPASVSFGPQKDQTPLRLGDMVAQLAAMLDIAEINTITNLAASEPWKHVFDVDIAPNLTVQLTSQPSVHLVIDLFESGNRGVHLPGTTMPSWIKIEPNFTVYSLIVGYDSSRGGLDLRALVSFDEQASAIAARGGNADQPGKTELVSFPFPSPPPSNANLQVKYLGLGQHFGPTVDVQAPDPLAAMFDKLEKTFTTNDPATLLTQLAGYYDPQRDWFVGAHVLMRGWEVRAVFNDPVLYGLEVTCTAETFQGLLLEILYQKLGDGLGVYYGALTLPAQYRTIQLGVVSLTLPSFRIWIYTNGDFKVSVGWPLGPNSIGVQVYVFTGGGGFYFAKLRSGDNPTSGQQALLAAGSAAADVMSYSPILEFGLGAWFGLGRSINSGPFSASLSLTLQGTFQGVLAWEAPPAPGPGVHPPATTLSRPPDYYWFAATVSLIGQLQGAVDLKVIKLSVFVRLSVTAGVAFEKQYASQVLVCASVDVEASLKILFVTISVGFHATISETFQLSGGLQPPASLEHPNNPAFSAMNDWVGRGLPALEQRMLARRAPITALTRAARPLPQAPAAAQVVDLSFLLQPSAVYAGSTGTASAVASLTIGCPAPVSSTARAPSGSRSESDSGSGSGSGSGSESGSQTPMQVLLAALGSWLLRTYSTDGHWDTVVTQIGEGSAAPPADWESRVYGFLEQEIRFVLHPVDLTAANDDMHVAFFPMLADLALIYNGQTVDFAHHARTPSDYPDAVADYFAALALGDGGSLLLTDARSRSLSDVPTGPGLAVTIFDDYLLTIARQLAREYAATDSPDSAAVAANIGGLSSRYLLSGLRLPDPASVPSTGPINPANLTIDSGYALTGQQFAIDTTSSTCEARLQIGPDPSPLAACIKFAGGAQSVSSSMPVAPLPPAPAPTWSGPSAAVNAAAATVTIDAIAAAHACDRTVAVRTRLPWQGPAGSQFVVPLPPAVLSETAAQPMQLTVTDSAAPPKSYPVTPMLLIPVTVHLVNRNRNSDVTAAGSGAATSAAPTSPYAPYVYRVDGTDDETRDRIEAALTSGAPGAHLHVLYDGPHSGYLSDKIDLHAFPLLLAKTNLSTTSQPDTVNTPLRLLAQSDLLGPSSAPLSSSDDFLRLLWEASVVRSGGLYLHYQDAGGNGLPNDIFSPPGQPPVGGVPTGDTATLTIAVVFDGETTFQRWHNAFAVQQLDPAYEGTLYLGLRSADGTAIQDLSPSYPPGCIAFSGQWANEELLRAASMGLYSEDWVAHLYHLIQFRLDGQQPGSFPAFGSSLWSLAITPSQDPDASADANARVQTYRQVVPVHRFLTAGASNPYAAVGGAPTLTMRLLDVFGNTLDRDTHAASFDVRYNDPLWTPAEWPGVRIAYRFVPGATRPTLDLNLQFDPAAVIRTGAGTGSMMVHGLSDGEASEQDKVVQQVQVALQQYALVTGQLADPNTSAALTSTVLPSLNYSSGLAASLLSFAQSVVTELEKGLPGRSQQSSGPQPLSARISIPIDPADLATATEDILELSVILELSRPAALVFTDPSGRMVPKSQSNLATLAADLDPPDSGTPRALARAQSQGGDPPSDVALAQFAKDFEEVFVGYDKSGGGARLAIRSDNADLSTPDTAFLWVIRWSPQAGVDVSFSAGQAAFFALAPLSLNLDGGDAQVPTYGPDPSQPVYTSRTFSDIDLDAWAQSFLLNFDATLSPQSATAVAAVDPGAYGQLMLAKDVVAQCLAACVMPVYQPGSAVLAGDLAAARDHLKQAALGSLSSAFGTSSIVQVPAAIHTAGNEGPAGRGSRLFGGIQVLTGADHTGMHAEPPVPAGQVSVSSAKLPLVATTEVNPAHLSFSVSVADASVAANISVDLKWRARFAEHLTAGVAEFGYQPSEWLRVVLERPQDPLDFELGTLAVPIPERRFPITPVLRAQSAVQSAPGQSGTDPLAPYLRWDYGAGLTMPELASQDALWLNVMYNLPVTQLTALLGEPEVTLFQALASFTTAWPQLSPYLQGVVDGEQQPPPAKVIEAYLSQVKLVTRAWARMKGVPDPWAGEPSEATGQHDTGGAVDQLVDSYQISFQDAFIGQHLIVYARAQLDGKGGCDQATLTWPTINGQSPKAGSISSVCTPASNSCTDAPTTDPCWYRAVYAFDPPPPGQACALELSWPELDVLARQTAKLDCWGTRNSWLSGDVTHIPTNPAFVYRTPVVTFASPVVPTITVPPLGPLPAQATLSANLSQALKVIAQAGGAAASRRKIKVALNYSFELPGSAGMQASTAILLADQVDLLPEGGTGPGYSLTQLCDELDTSSRVWFTYYHPVTDNATVSVYLVLFAEVAGSQLPVLQIERLQLAVPAGWWHAH